MPRKTPPATDQQSVTPPRVRRVQAKRKPVVVKPMGRPQFQPNSHQRELVRRLAAYGIPWDEIAAMVPVAPKTLTKHFSEELQIGRVEMVDKVASRLFNIATAEPGGKEAVTACIFILKCRGGWREKDSEPAGKRAAAEAAAMTAEKGTGWDELLQ